jgi:hypothetical protein
MEDHATDDVPHRLETELKRGQDAEGFTPASDDAPEQISVLDLPGMKQVALGADLLVKLGTASGPEIDCELAKRLARAGADAA